MELRDLARLVFSNLRRMKGRVIMTALGVVIGTAAVIVLVSLGVGLQRQATESLGAGGSLTQLRVSAMPQYEMVQAMPVGGGGREPSQQDQVRLDAAAVEEIRALPSVKAVYPVENCRWGRDDLRAASWLGTDRRCRAGDAVGAGCEAGIDRVAPWSGWSWAVARPRTS